MTYAELIAHLDARINDADNGRFAAALKQIYLNQALRELYGLLYERTEFYLKSTTVVTAAAAVAANLPADFRQMRRVYSADQNYELEFTEKYSPGWTGETGQPFKYFIYGNMNITGTNTSTSYMQIGFYPTPNAAYTFTIDYYPIVAEMTATTDQPGIPVDFHDLIVMRAGMKCMADVGDWDLYNGWKGEYNERLDQFTRMAGTAQYPNPPPLVNVFGGDSDLYA